MTSQQEPMGVKEALEIAESALNDLKLTGARAAAVLRAHLERFERERAFTDAALEFQRLWTRDHRNTLDTARVANELHQARHRFDEAYRALLARIEAASTDPPAKRQPCNCGGPDCVGTELPPPAERTAEDWLIGLHARMVGAFGADSQNADMVLTVHRLVRDLRQERDEWARNHAIVVESYNKACVENEKLEAERDALARRIELAKAELMQLHCENATYGRICRCHACRATRILDFAEESPYGMRREPESGE